ncbi:hypothetical protein [Leptolyngbya sp. NIES-2104]|uniref:hypothetical protein n=1 Tax=Leptolyngbya sp. NIES-2104 TaxID=1552121 RepID=UPI0006EC88C5|nr:hypothetical protein [Leptolyngbya sp. NIES-2104]GAP99324.1 hypothetical protein NIES2104_58850 [Leptolyngbya sp. NIES-2104]
MDSLRRVYDFRNATIDVYDTCGNRYYSAEILHTIHAVATGARSPERTEQVPIAFPQLS